MKEIVEDPTPCFTKEQIIEQVLMQGNITQGGKESIQKALLSTQSKQDRVSFIRSAYGYCGVSMRLDGGGHYRWSADSKGIAVDYQDGSLAFVKTLSWSEAEAIISDLVMREAYHLPEDIHKKRTAEVET